ncbi:MAG: aromatic ring-hydroxylating dioxygenase subunit alpha [Dongiaceae bacterium]
MAASSVRVEEILSRAALAGLERPTEAATGLPSIAYTSDEFLALEQELLFAPGWVYAGAAAELPEPGARRAVTVAGRPLLLTRNRAGEIRAFHNVCSHRNALLVREGGRPGPTITCPYHAWSYDLDGRLLRTPDIGGPGVASCAGLDKGALGLKPVRAASWAGLVFVNLDGEAPPLEQFLRPLTERWSAWDLGQLRFGGSRTYELATNWKHAVENYLESYHLTWVHPGLNSYSRVDDHYCFFAGPDICGQGTERYAPGDFEGVRLPGPDLPAGDAVRAEYPVLLPNLMTGLQADHFYIIDVIPLAPGRTRERFDIYFFGEAALEERFGALREHIVERWDGVFREDIEVVERLQQGHASPAATGGRFSPAQEQAVHHFQRRIVARMLGRDALPAAKAG